MGWIDFIAEQWLLVGLFIALIIAFVTLESKKGGKTISYHEVSRLLNSEEAILLDVRDAADYKAGHVIGAVNIPHISLATRIDELNAYKDKQIIVADKIGQHAGYVGKTLREKGFDTLRLQGGMSEWVAQNLPVVKAGKSKNSSKSSSKNKGKKS